MQVNHNVFFLCVHMQEGQYRGHGITDGTYRNERYFHCEDKCGLFVALDKLSMDREGNILEKAPRGGHGYAKAASHKTAARRPTTIHNDRLPRFKKGDRVVAIDKKGIYIHGTVRWSGMNKAVRNLVGIETVSSAYYSRFHPSIRRMGM